MDTSHGMLLTLSTHNRYIEMVVQDTSDGERKREGQLTTLSLDRDEQGRIKSIVISVLIHRIMVCIEPRVYVYINKDNITT